MRWGACPHIRRRYVGYERYKSAHYFDYGQSSLIFRSRNEITGGIERSKDKSVALLGQAIKSLDEQLNEHSSDSPVNHPSPESTRLPSSKVFVVHGHDEATLQDVARFLERLKLGRLART